MKLEKMAIANAFALSSIVLWILCTVFVVLLPDFSLTVTQWWMHGLNISAMGSWNLNFGNFLFGGIALAISAWITGYVLGWCWEFVSKR